MQQLYTTEKKTNQRETIEILSYFIQISSPPPPPPSSYFPSFFLWNCFAGTIPIESNPKESKKERKKDRKKDRKRERER